MKLVTQPDPELSSYLQGCDVQLRYIAHPISRHIVGLELFRFSASSSSASSRRNVSSGDVRLNKMQG